MVAMLKFICIIFQETHRIIVHVIIQFVKVATQIGCFVAMIGIGVIGSGIYCAFQDMEYEMQALFAVMELSFPM